MRKPQPPYIEYGFKRTSNGVQRIWYGFEPEPERRETWKSFGTLPGLRNFLTMRYGREKANQLINDKVPL